MTVLHNVYSIPPPAASWNPILGRAKGVFGPDITNGSSSGSAIALATGMCAASLGGEICGSIVDPCRAAGLYGFKPSSGLIQDGNIGSVAISDRYDVTGPMGRGVMDLAMVLDGMMGQGDEGQRGGFVDALAHEESPGLTVKDRGKERKLRVGVIHPIPYPGDPPEVFARIRHEFLTAINAFRGIPDIELIFETASRAVEADGIPAVDAFCTTPNDEAFTFPKSLWSVQHERGYKPYRKAAHAHRGVDMYHLMNRFLSGLTFPAGQTAIKTVEELAGALREMPNPHLGESGTDGNIAHIDRMLELRGDASMEEYQRATEMFARVMRDMCGFMRENRLDVVISPLRLCVFSTAAGAPLVCLSPTIPLSVTG
jgi:amidase